MPMNWNELLAPYRFTRSGSIETLTEEGRSPFAKDQDKIIFSSAFRRLSKKTQVHPMVENDHIHTRLTHSVEVASVGRTIGSLVGARLRKERKNEITHQESYKLGEIVQAACLAHDIGNTPFGHAGESAIQDWFEQHHEVLHHKKPNDGKLIDHQQTDFTAFDGNAMGFRILTQTEYDTFHGGMRLSFPTLATTLKYPWLSIQTIELGKKKFSCLYSERKIMATICDKLGIIKHGDFHYARHPLAYLVEVADDICNNLLDLEDAREMGTVSFNEILSICKGVHKKDNEFKKMMSKNMSDRRKLAYLRGKTIHKLIHSAVDAFMSNYDDIMSGSTKIDGEPKIIPLVDLFEEESKSLIEATQNICHNKIFNHPKKIEIELGSYNAIGAMLDSCYEAASEIFGAKADTSITFKTLRVLSLLGMEIPKEDGACEEGTAARLLEHIYGKTKTGSIKNEVVLYNLILPFLDYLCGMTDNFATHISQQIMGRAASSMRN